MPRAKKRGQQQKAATGWISPQGQAFVDEVDSLAEEVILSAPPPPEPAFDLPLSPKTARNVKAAAGILFTLTVCLSLLMAIVLLLNAFSANGVGGMRFFVEPTDAMKPAISRGALLITVHRKPADIQPGYIITFYAVPGEQDTRLTRYVAERIDETGQNGNTKFRTKRAADALPDSILINQTSILGVKWIVLPSVGYVISFAQTYAWGIAVFAAAMCVAGVLLRRWLREKGHPEKKMKKRKKAEKAERLYDASAL